MKILMVCLGNICRSPMAEGILRHLAKEQDKHLIIDSAGTSNYHIGEQPDARAIQKMKAHGIDISDLSARQLKSSDFEKFDLILVMDESNYENSLRLAKNDEQKAKVKLILDYGFPNENLSVPDPYYDSEDGFETVYQMLMTSCKQLIEQI